MRATNTKRFLNTNKCKGDIVDTPHGCANVSPKCTNTNKNIRCRFSFSLPKILSTFLHTAIDFVADLLSVFPEVNEIELEIKQ
jgi:hypothetical protein